MKLIFKKRTSDRTVSRLKKRVRIRKKISGTATKPRLCIFKSSKNIYAQVIDDETGKTLVSCSSLGSGQNSANSKMAQDIGKKIAAKALEADIKNVVFDRSGYLYHGRIKAFADAAREAGLEF